jgi:uncharacterized secreted protein with C-terminal beta-propeller domain
MEPTLNPGSRPRRGVALVLVGAVVAATVTVAVLAGGSSTPVAAAGLETFRSCAELEAWGDEQLRSSIGAMEGEVAMDRGVPETSIAEFQTVGGEISADATSAAPMPTAGAAESGRLTAGGADGDTGGTNVVVEGVDELDLVERLSDDRALFASATALVLVDLADGERIARTAVAPGAQITYDPEAGIAWVVGSSSDGTGIEVRRVAVTDGELLDRGAWSTSGSLVTARRVGDLLHVVATEGFTGIGQPIPFDDGPVPCDQVLRPEGPSDATATLIATLPVGGDLEPLRSTEVVGSGQLVHLTLDVAYLATPQWEEAGQTTTIHRFDLADLEHTGSGRVPGSLFNDFSMSDHDGHLRVAVTAGQGGFGVVGRPMPIEGDGGIGDTPVAPVPMTEAPVPEELVEPNGAVVEGADPTAEPLPAPPETTVPDPTDPTDPTDTSTTTPEATTTTEVTTTTEAPTTTEATTTTEAPTTTAATTTTEAPTLPPVEQPGPDDPLNQVLVLDIEGTLDVVGRTPWFGLPGETLHGIRFDGPTAYAVTFLQTDPFYVLDLADPAAPRIAGEVKLPGFSSYLHPVGDGLVVGFGPGEDGRAAAKLFDVSDPSAPAVVDTVVLGDDAPIVYDHHAFTALGEGRFATPVTSWSSFGGDCEVPAVPEPGPDGGPGDVPATTSYECGPSQLTSEVVELAVDGTDLVELSRTPVVLAEPASRVLVVDDGWALLAGTTVALVDAEGELRTSVDLT